MKLWSSVNKTVSTLAHQLEFCLIIYIPIICHMWLVAVLLDSVDLERRGSITSISPPLFKMGREIL